MGGMSDMAAGLQAGYSIYQSVKAGKEEKKYQKELDKLKANRPQYQIPDEYKKNIALQEGIVKGYDPYTKTSQLAGQSYMQNRIDANTANQTAIASQQGVGSPSGMAALYGAAMNAQNEATTDMNIKGAENRKDYQQLYANATSGLQDKNIDMADQRVTQWNQNTYEPYATEVEEFRRRTKDATERKRGFSKQTVDTTSAAMIKKDQDIQQAAQMAMKFI